MKQKRSSDTLGPLFSVSALVIFAWLSMQWTHELGHVAGGLATGAELDRVILDPRTFSQTLFESNPRPLLTVWAGPAIGVLVGAGIPLVLATKLGRWRSPLLIVSAFTLLVNGLYIGLGPVMAVGDARDMLRLGTPQWIMILFGLVGIAAARAALAPLIAGSVPLPDRRHGLVALSAAVALAAAGLLLFPR